MKTNETNYLEEWVNLFRTIGLKKTCLLLGFLATAAGTLIVADHQWMSIEAKHLQIRLDGKDAELAITNRCLAEKNAENMVLHDRVNVLERLVQSLHSRSGNSSISHSTLPAKIGDSDSRYFLQVHHGIMTELDRERIMAGYRKGLSYLTNQAALVVTNMPRNTMAYVPDEQFIGYIFKDKEHMFNVGTNAIKAFELHHLGNGDMRLFGYTDEQTARVVVPSPGTNQTIVLFPKATGTNTSLVVVSLSRIENVRAYREGAAEGGLTLTILYYNNNDLIVQARR